MRATSEIGRDVERLALATLACDSRVTQCSSRRPRDIPPKIAEIGAAGYLHGPAEFRAQNAIGILYRKPDEKWSSTSNGGCRPLPS